MPACKKQQASGLTRLRNVKLTLDCKVKLVVREDKTKKFRKLLLLLFPPFFCGRRKSAVSLMRDIFPCLLSDQFERGHVSQSRIIRELITLPDIWFGM